MSGSQRRAETSQILRTSCWDAGYFCTMIPAIDRTGCSRERPRCISTKRVLTTSWFRLCRAAKINQNTRPIGSQYVHEREKHHENFTSWICSGGFGGGAPPCCLALFLPGGRRPPPHPAFVRRTHARRAPRGPASDRRFHSFCNERYHP